MNPSFPNKLDRGLSRCVADSNVCILLYVVRWDLIFYMCPFVSMQGLLLEMMESSTFPPIPDAFCRHGNCIGHIKTAIYFTDPDFKVSGIITFPGSSWILDFLVNDTKPHDGDLILRDSFEYFAAKAVWWSITLAVGRALRRSPSLIRKRYVCKW